jgi:hypothetical protein
MCHIIENDLTTKWLLLTTFTFQAYYLQFYLPLHIRFDEMTFNDINFLYQTEVIVLKTFCPHINS